ncbi:LacI family DNA-binding transcriptional regulator [Streptomyces sp. NRRL F-5123]|uniref:LacI family DNA-binding transcriptional regulator n=1 Tax=Streptomyces sp. NRRL F-5123 TaxID=1463856 RepID=UPI0004E118E7|nr:LacI family DNA-binding transcriptional regulator [Streptomyces sp. NRRL F-5123]
MSTMPEGGRVTSIWDIARIAGVSHQTVSRVINGKPHVKASTRDLVLRTIDELGFTPSKTARALAGGSARTVTVLAVDTALYGCSATLRGIEEAARGAGFSVAISVLERDAARSVQDVESRLGNPRTPAIVIAFEAAGARAFQALDANLPAVGVVERPDDGEAVCVADPARVWIDDRLAAAHATRHLLGMGHRTVHYLALPSSTAHVGQRALGRQDALEEAGRPVPEPVACGWTPRDGYLAARSLLADRSVTAVLCGNDDIALGVLRAAREHRRPVPDSVSVVGFDDAPHAAYLAPTLTTVRLDFEGLGRAAFARLHALLEPEAAPLGGAWDEPELIVRESSGPAPTPAGTT